MINQVALRYAHAMYQVAQGNSQDQYLAELRAISEAFDKNPEIPAFFTSPSATPENKQNILKSAFSTKVSPDVFNLLLLLNDKNRMDIVCDIARAFETMIDDARGVSRGAVRSASALDADQRKKLEETVKKVTGRQVILKFDIDPTLVGGLVAKVGGWTFDDSLSAHLQTMKDHLSRRTTVGH